MEELNLEYKEKYLKYKKKYLDLKEEIGGQTVQSLGKTCRSITIENVFKNDDMSKQNVQLWYDTEKKNFVSGKQAEDNTIWSNCSGDNISAVKCRDLELRKNIQDEDKNTCNMYLVTDTEKINENKLENIQQNTLHRCTSNKNINNCVSTCKNLVKEACGKNENSKCTWIGRFNGCKRDCSKIKKENECKNTYWDKKDTKCYWNEGKCSNKKLTCKNLKEKNCGNNKNPKCTWVKKRRWSGSCKKDCSKIKEKNECINNESWNKNDTICYWKDNRCTQEKDCSALINTLNNIRNNKKKTKDKKIEETVEAIFKIFNEKSYCRGLIPDDGDKLIPDSVQALYNFFKYLEKFQEEEITKIAFGEPVKVSTYTNSEGHVENIIDDYEKNPMELTVIYITINDKYTKAFWYDASIYDSIDINIRDNVNNVLPSAFFTYKEKVKGQKQNSWRTPDKIDLHKGIIKKFFTDYFKNENLSKPIIEKLNGLI